MSLLDLTPNNFSVIDKSIFIKDSIGVSIKERIKFDEMV